ncbi:hypothetical protein [Streptomyces odonnellii]|uniref:hypothetical protein n=1 Tax=Streptomyces odonnellii TaxID=1417980 RepID=UPI0006251E91|nr:hypothetical protein [Streptomyces odonnellii]
MPKDEAAALMDLLGGHGFAVRSQSSMVRGVLRRLLFAIIGTQMQRDDEQLPRQTGGVHGRFGHLGPA